MSTEARGTVTVNGTTRELSGGEPLLLIDYLRDSLRLTAGKVGCNTGDCGTCTLLVDGCAVNGCLVYTAEAVGQDVVTCEQVCRDGVGARVQEEMLACDAIQCGFCIPGLVVNAAALIEAQDQPLDGRAVAAALGGNVCRCTGYVTILEALERVSSEKRSL